VTNEQILIWNLARSNTNGRIQRRSM